MMLIKKDMYIFYETNNIFFCNRAKFEKLETTFWKPLSPKAKNVACTLENTELQREKRNPLTATVKSSHELFLTRGSLHMRKSHEISTVAPKDIIVAVNKT